MKLCVKYDYKEYYLPNKRCKNERYRRLTTTAQINITSVTENEFPVAFIIHDYKSRDNDFKLVSDEVRTFNGKLYMIWRIMSGDGSGNIRDVPDLINTLERSSGYEYDYYPGYKDNEKFSGKSITIRDNKVEHIKAMETEADRYVIDDKGMIWEECGEPMYHIQTFGLGHNHGGTGFFIDHIYNPNCSAKTYFSALQYEEAKEYFKQTALGRGDTESIGTYKEDYIEVLMPEMVTRNPKEEHGEGDKFMNEIEDIITASNNSFEAGLFTLMKTFS